MGEALPWGMRLKHLWLFFMKIGANEGNLCVLLDCCGKREADTAAKAFELLIWAVTKVLKRWSRAIVLLWGGFSHLGRKLAEHLPGMSNREETSGYTQNLPEGLYISSVSSGKSWKTLQRRRKSGIFYSACWKSGGRWMDLLSYLPGWYGDGSGCRSSHEPLLSLLRKEVHQCQFKALQPGGKCGAVVAEPSPIRY